MMRQRMIWMACCLLAMTAMSCTTTTKYMAGGATLGAVTGGVWANEAGLLSAAEGALVGGATGATAGALVGEAIEQGEWEELRNALDEKDQQIASLQDENNSLRQQLSDCQDRVAALTEEVERLKKQGRALAEYTLLADVLFEPGKARLSDEGKQQLDKVAQRITSDYPNMHVMVEGHTDTQPIQYSNWKDNWELGCARSLAVLRYLIEKGVAAERGAASTYSFHQPAVEGTSPEALAQNRRAVITVHTGIEREANWIDK